MTIGVNETLADGQATADTTCIVNFTGAQNPSLTLAYKNAAAATLVQANTTITHTYNSGLADTQTSTPTSSVAGTVYTAVVTDAKPFITVTATGTTGSPGTTLTYTIIPAAADALGTNATLPARTAHVTLTAGLVTTNFTVILTESTGSTSLLSNPTSLAFQYVSASLAAVSPQSASVTDSIITDTAYTVGVVLTNGPAGWLTVASANGLPAPRAFSPPGPTCSLIRWITPSSPLSPPETRTVPSSP